MDDYKHILASKTVWSGIVGFVAFVLPQLGVTESFDQTEVVDNILNVVTGLSFLGAIVFRAMAKKPIG